MLVPFTSGQRLTAAALNAAFDVDRMAYQVADSPPLNNSTTLVSSATMTLTVASSSVYLYEALYLFTAATAADFKHNVALPAGSLMRQAKWSAITTVTVGSTAVELDAVESATFNAGALGTGTIMSIRPTGVIAIGITAGSATAQYAQATANASDLILRLGSWMRLRKVA